MTTNKIKSLFQRGKKSIGEKGLFLFLRHLLLHHVVHCIYENNLNGPFFPCRVNNAQLKIISSAGEFDYLLEKGFDFMEFPVEVQEGFPINIQEYKKRLEKGAVLFCLLCNGDVAHTSWVGFSEGAFRDFYPFSPENSSAGYTGGTITASKYRRRGINLYIHSEIFQYLKKRKKSKALAAVRKENMVARHSQEKLGSYIKEEKHELRLLLFFSFKWSRPHFS